MNQTPLLVCSVHKLQPSQMANKADWDKSLSLIQHWLFDLGGEVCIPNYNLLQPVCIEFLEKEIDRMNEDLFKEAYPTVWFFIL